jgi:hypothetical protein
VRGVGRGARRIDPERQAIRRRIGVTDNKLLGNLTKQGSARMSFKSNIPAIPVLLILLSAHFSAHAAEPKICDLMTRQQATALAGAPVNAGQEQSITKGPSMCLYTASGSGGQTVSVGVMGKESFHGASAAVAFKAATSAGNGDKVESIPGLGETAVLVLSADDNALNVLYHDRIINVDATGSKIPGLRAALIAAAKLVLEKLQ